MGSSPSIGSVLFNLLGRYSSGQRGQTVNLLALPSQVRILPPPPEILAFMTRKQYKCHRSERSRIFHCIFNKNLSFFDPEFMNIYAHIAQSVEHFLGKEEVTGSNPVMGYISLIFGKF